MWFNFAMRQVTIFQLKSISLSREFFFFFSSLTTTPALFFAHIRIHSLRKFFLSTFLITQLDLEIVSQTVARWYFKFIRKYSTCHMHVYFLLLAFCNENSFMLHFFIVAVSCHSNFYSSHSLKANFSHKMRVLENCTIEDCRSRWKCA